MRNCLFGKAVGRAVMRGQGHRDVLVLRAYPSALHVTCAGADRIWSRLRLRVGAMRTAAPAAAVDDETRAGR